MTFDQFISKYSGKKLDWDKAYQGQCVDLFRFYVHEVLDLPQPRGVVGAADFWTNYESDPILKNNFTQIKNTPDFIPQKGDVMIWNKKAGGGFGHIAVVIEADINSFTSFDQNWRALNVSEPTKHDYKNVYGVLRPLQSNQGGSTPGKIELEKEKFEELVTKSTWYDEHHEKYQNLENKKTEFDQFKDTISQRLEVLAKNLSTVIDWDAVINASARFSQLDSKNLELQDKLEREIQSHKETVLKHDDRFRKLENRIEKMEKDHKLEIETIQNDYAQKLQRIKDEVKQEREELQKAKEQYELVTRFSKWVKNLFERK